MLLKYLLATSKKENSFKKLEFPTENQIEVYLKSETSIINPIFVVNGDFKNITYVYSADFDRFYFVRNVSATVNNSWELECEIDVLATYKSEILQQSAFVERSSTGYNINIIDRLVTTTTNTDILSSRVKPDFFDNTGTYFLSCADNLRMSATYQIEEGYLSSLANELMTDTGFIDEMQKYYNQPMNAIYSLHWLPFSLGFFNSSEQRNIEIANWTSDIAQGRFVYDSAKKSTFYIDIPKPFSDYRNVSETLYTLYIMGCSPITINSNLLENFETLLIEYTVDCVDGNVAVRVYGSGGISPLLAKISGNLKTSLPIASITFNPLAIVGGVAGGLSSVAIGELTSNPIMMASGLFSTISSALLRPQVQATGNYQGRSAYESDYGFCQLSCVYSSTIEPSNLTAKLGRPVGKVGTLANYTGYIKCDSASVEVSGTIEEIEKINELLNSGVYNE